VLSEEGVYDGVSGKRLDDLVDWSLNLIVREIESLVYDEEADITKVSQVRMAPVCTSG
jgi:hypothetical protein